jgi:hypothetical protein
MCLILAMMLLGADGPINDKVVEFARSKVGQRVGRGECTDLAREALRYSGARVFRGRPGTCGDELKSVRDARPGDILQFEGAVFVRQRLEDDGTRDIQMFSYPHHTAIVARVRKRGSKPVLVILHQNTGPEGSDKRVVQEWTLDMAEKTRGTVKAYRPTAN